MSESKSSSPANTFVNFFALYFTTLFSLDTWSAARASPYRGPGNNTYFRPANNPSEYQAGMHGRGNAGPAGPDRRTGRTPQVIDSRPAFRMGVTNTCGSCME